MLCLLLRYCSISLVREQTIQCLSQLLEMGDLHSITGLIGVVLKNLVPTNLQTLILLLSYLFCKSYRTNCYKDD